MVNLEKDSGVVSHNMGKIEKVLGIVSHNMVNLEKDSGVVSHNMVNLEKVLAKEILSYNSLKKSFSGINIIIRIKRLLRTDTCEASPAGDVIFHNRRLHLNLFFCIFAPLT